MPILLLLVGRVIGFGLSRWHQSPNRETRVGKTSTAPRNSASIKVAAPQLGLDQILAQISADLERGYFRADRRWNEILEAVTATAISEVIAKVQASDSRGKPEFLRALYERWGLLDAAAALVSAQRSSSERSEQRDSNSDAVLKSWAYTNVREMAARTLQLDHRHLRESAVKAISHFPDDLDLETIIRIPREESNRVTIPLALFAGWNTIPPPRLPRLPKPSSSGPAGILFKETWPKLGRTKILPALHVGS